MKNKRWESEKKEMIGIKDLDKIILNKLEDKYLFQILRLNKQLNNLCDDVFFYNRLKEKHPHLCNLQEKEKSEKTWKEYYIENMKYILKLKQEYSFDFTVYGTPERHYNLVSKIKNYYKPCNDLDLVLHKTSELRDILIEMANGKYEDVILYQTNLVNKQRGLPIITSGGFDFYKEKTIIYKMWTTRSN